MQSVRVYSKRIRTGNTEDGDDEERVNTITGSREDTIIIIVIAITKR